MSDHTNLAAHLLAFAPSTEVVDALLSAAVITDDAVLIAAAPSTTLAASVAKKGVRYATSVAGAPVHDPDLLGRLGKLPQKTVRRLVAANPDTPPETLDKLSQWALKENDDETLDALCGTLPPPQWLAVMRHRRYCGHSPEDRFGAGQRQTLPVDRVVEQLVRREDVALIWDTYRLELPVLCRAIGLAAARGRLPVSAAELVNDSPYDLQPAVLDAIVGDTSLVLDSHLVAKVAAWLQRPDVQLSERYRLRLSAARNLDENGVNMYVRCGEPLLAECAAKSASFGRAELTDDHLEHLIHGGNRVVADILLTSERLRPRLSAAQLAAVATTAAPATSVVRKMLKEYGTELPPAARVNLLRNGDPRVTAEWITGQFGYAPTLGELEDLASNPGSCAGGQRLSTVAELIERFAASFGTEHAELPGMDVVFNAAASTTLRWAAQAQHSGSTHVPNGFTAYLAQRLSAAFGSDAHAWSTAARLAEKVTVGTVDDFITVVAGMSATAHSA